MYFLPLRICLTKNRSGFLEKVCLIKVFTNLHSSRRQTAKLILALTWAPTLVFGVSAPPSIFYSDVDSGPNMGGENSRGAYVTIYGKGFGYSQGSSFVTVGGGMATYPVWTGSSWSVCKARRCQHRFSTRPGFPGKCAGDDNGLPCGSLVRR